MAPSPEPVELVELEMIRLLAGSGAIVVCAGSGGVPVVRDDARRVGHPSGNASDHRRWQRPQAA